MNWLIDPIAGFGKYVLFLRKLFVQMESFLTYLRLLVIEAYNMGNKSLALFALVSLFMGAVTLVQTSYNLISPLIPRYVLSMVVRDMTLLELAPTIMGIIFAGKVGSNISSELGTMRITEQIDALEVMGINSVSYLVLPKILSAVIIFPVLVIFSMGFCLFGGFLAAMMTDTMTAEEYSYGLQYDFVFFKLTYAIIKALFFAFLIASVSAYTGYHVQGGALEVGQASTAAVTRSCVAILSANYVLANILL